MRIRNVATCVRVGCCICDRVMGPRARMVECCDPGDMASGREYHSICIPCARRIGVAAVREK